MKAFKLFSMAAAALLMAACSNEDNAIEQQPAQSRSMHFVATIAAPNSGAATRTTYTLGKNEQEQDIINVKWNVDDQIALIHNNKKEVVKVKSVDSTTGDATIEGDITGASDGDPVILIYPASGVGEDGQPTEAAQLLQSTQDGTLEYIQNNLDARMGNGQISVPSSGDATLKANVKMASQMAIWKLTLQDNAATPSALSATQLALTVGTTPVAVAASTAKSVWYISYPVAAIAKGSISGDLTISATVGSDTYTYKKTGGISLTAGTYYQSTVTIYKMAKGATSTDKGKLICTDGHIHANGEDAACTKARVAIITYVGSDNGEAAPYNHGLALAMSDANGGSGCQWKTSNTDAGHTKQGSSSFTSESGLQYNAMHNSEIDNYPAFKAAIANNSTAAPTGCSAWFLASGYQWTKMFAGDADGLKTLAGLELDFYWCSSESSADLAWFFVSDYGGWIEDTKGSDYLVRSCLAF